MDIFKVKFKHPQNPGVLFLAPEFRAGLHGTLVRPDLTAERGRFGGVARVKERPTFNVQGGRLKKSIVRLPFPKYPPFLTLLGVAEAQKTFNSDLHASVGSLRQVQGSQELRRRQRVIVHRAPVRHRTLARGDQGDRGHARG